MSSVCFADDHRKPFGAYIAVGLTGLDDDAALEEGVDDSLFSVKLGVEMYRSAWVLGGGFSVFFYDDNEEFKQAVEDIGGDVSTEDSSAMATNLFVESGYRHVFAENVFADLLAGYEYVVSSERSISNCRDCFEEDIEISSGFYLAPRFQFKKENGVTISLIYQQHLSGDVDNSIMLAVGVSR